MGAFLGGTVIPHVDAPHNHEGDCIRRGGLAPLLMAIPSRLSPL